MTSSEYNRGFPTLQVTFQPSLTTALFPDSYFYLSPLSQSVVLLGGKPGATAYSHDVLDLVSEDAIKHLLAPLPSSLPYRTTFKILLFNIYPNRLGSILRERSMRQATWTLPDF